MDRKYHGARDREKGTIPLASFLSFYFRVRTFSLLSKIFELLIFFFEFQHFFGSFNLEDN